MKIAICHYRVGGTDGVSLEINKRKEILEALGHQVHLLAGEKSRGYDHLVRALDWDSGRIPALKENGYKFYQRQDLDSAELKAEISRLSRRIEDRLNFIQLKEKYDWLLVHNIFSFGAHFAAAKALAKWIKNFRLPTLATHHDFHWDRQEFALPRNAYLRNIMAKYMPPKSKHIRHVVINSLAQRQLRLKYDIRAEIMPDVFDFRQKEWRRDGYNRGFLSELGIGSGNLVVLQATRIMPRKGIELAVDFVRSLEERMGRIRGRSIYNGKKIGPKAGVVLLLAGYAETEKRDQEYLRKLKARIKAAGIKAVFASGIIGEKRRPGPSGKTYSLWDAYAHADLVAYPSLWEGWGNQFIEAVFARKPVVMLEYPVYAKDIKKEGYRVISLGSRSGLDRAPDGLYGFNGNQAETAAGQSLDWLCAGNTAGILEKNRRIGENYHSYDILKSFLIKHIRQAPGPTG